MKIAIPTIDDRGLAAVLSEHFGQSSFFTVVDSETGEVRSERNTGQHHGGGSTPAEIIVDAGAGLVLCAGLGRRAVARFREAGIQVFMGAQGTVQDALNAHREGKLEPATEEAACHGRPHHEEG